jgi:hypothetical protein
MSAGATFFVGEINFCSVAYPAAKPHHKDTKRTKFAWFSLRALGLCGFKKLSD